MKQGGLGCRVFTSLLVICYLEVVLWTSCLFLCGAASVPGAAFSHDYLLRETVNLKLVRGDSQAAAPCPDRAEAFRRADLQRILESVFLLRRKDFVQPATPTVLQEAIVGLSNLPVSNGLPAPFAGVKGIA